LSAIKFVEFGEQLRNCHFHKMAHMCWLQLCDTQHRGRSCSSLLLWCYCVCCAEKDGHC